MTAPTALVVQHHEVEAPARLGEALDRAGCLAQVVRVDLGQELPEGLDGHDALVVMGGPMSAISDDGFPTRDAEVALLREALVQEIPVVGFCLGAQLLAAAGGAEVRAGSGPEIGWAPVRIEPGAAGDPVLGESLVSGDQPTVLHWHGETFDLPSRAVHLASSANYRNQAFRIGPCAWGFQFHLEVDEASVAGFLSAFPAEAAMAPGGADGIRETTPGALRAWEPARTRVLDRFASSILQRGSGGRRT